ncbi:MAG TPA: serine/threonine-protein kinase [Gemmatimonadales bacterium]|jgi:TolB-like protein
MMSSRAERLDELRAALADHYEIERELGHGGMATVYLALDPRHDRTVALKVLRPELAASVGPDRFLREIRFAGKLQHPHLLPVFDSGESAGVLWYAMPYVQGESLRDLLRREVQLPLKQVTDIVRQVASALDHAHSAGIVHRDIKPENILLAGAEVLVADFGIAKAAESVGGKLTETGLSLGTPAYMSPEQASGGRVDARTDVYSLGCVAYEMLAGEPPFSGPTAQAIMARHAVEPVPAIRTIRPGVPASVEQVIHHALQKVAADRFASAGAFAEALTRENERSVPTLPSPAIRRERLWQVAALLLLALTVASAAGWHFLRQRGEGVAPQASVLAVLPFAPSVSDTTLARLGRDLAGTVSASLDGVGEIRAIDRLTILAQTRDRDTPLTVQEGARLGRRLGARSVVAGSLARQGRSVRLDCGLYSTDSLVALARVTVIGPADSLGALTDSLTWKLLGEIWRRGTPPTPTLGAITTRSVTALRAYLDGEQQLIAGEADRAMTSYHRAIEADSNFWFAYFRAANPAGWYEGPLDSTLERIYLAHKSAFPRREQLLMEAATPRKGTMWRFARMRELVQQYPDYWPGWWVLGDALVHGGGIVGEPMSEARFALERTVELNPNLLYGWGHLGWAYQQARDTAGLRRVVRTLQHLNAGPVFTRNEGTNHLLLFRLILALYTGSDSAKYLLDTLYRTDLAQLAATGSTPFAYNFALLGAGYPAVQIEFNRHLLHHGLPPSEASAHLEYIAMGWAQRGAWDSSLSTMEEVGRLGVIDDTSTALSAYRLAVTGAWLGALPAARAARVRRAAARLIRPGDSSRRGELAYLDGILAATQRDPRALAGARAALAGPESNGAILERSLAAFDLALTGDRKAAGSKLAELEWQLADRGGGDLEAHPYRRAISRLAASEWLLAAGDTTQALRLLAWHEAITVPVPEKFVFAPFAYLTKARVAEARGQSEAARYNYGQFLVRYDRPLPPQKGLVLDARAALQRLNHRTESSAGEQ